ncbi:hypothetical protein [Sphingobacterium cavernae]|uniref:hypothetical protein n=1 Tax=Sphingobacterium cavernae TaxID=2592657 RepID=UPI0012300B9B|nr:hypothetical protein [Sphingobacterium cavernae]
MKYIIIHQESYDDQAVTYPIIFPNELNHSDVADVITSLIRISNKRVETISAGFYNVGTGDTYGNSETLGLESRDIDDQIIKFRDYFIFDNIQKPNIKK